MSMALVMSEMPDVYRRVLAEHVPDGAGRCGACRNATGETASWPCQTYRIAQEAKWVGEGNLPGTGPHGSVNPRAQAAPARERETPSYELPQRTEYELPQRTERPEGGRRRRRDDDDLPFGSERDAPYGSSFGVDDRPRHAAH
jgi:hypothetical protein